MALAIDNPNKNVIDPYNTKRAYLQGKKADFKGIHAEDSDLIKRFISDMEKGFNVPKGKRGARSYSRLNSYRCKIPRVAGWIKKHVKKRMTEATAEDMITLFSKLSKGEIRTEKGLPYKAWSDYRKDFGTFWSWYRRINRQAGKEITDIMFDVPDKREDAPEFIYLNDEQFKKLFDNAIYYYKVLLLFCKDSGVRPPSELMNIRVSDIQEDKTNPKIAFLNVRQETSKTFGRKIKLMFSWSLLKEYIASKKLKPDDFLFTITPMLANRYLRRLSFRVLGIGQAGTRDKGEGKQAFDAKGGLTLYDLRHISACYWLPRYKSESALKYRFGWRSSKMIEYYSHFLGMKDNITEDDLLVDVTKSDLQKQLEDQQRQSELVHDELARLQEQVSEFLIRTGKQRQGKKQKS
jgi:hypothetical protein